MVSARQPGRLNSSRVVIPSKWYRDFLDDLREFLQAGFSILEAFETLARAKKTRGLAWHPSVRRAELASSLLQRIRDGSTLAEAMASRREIPEEHTAMVDAAERSGRLVPILGRLVERLDQQRETFAEFTRQVAYPLLVLTAAVVLVPLPFVVLGSKSTYLLIQALFFGPILLVGFLILKRPKFFRPGSPLRSTCEGYVLRLPLIGSLVTRFALGKVFGLLGMLLEAGLAFNEAVPLAARATSWKALEADVLLIESLVRSGKTVTEAFQSIPVFSVRPGWTARVTVGEKAGTLDRSFRELGANLEESARSLLKKGLRVLSFLLFISVGLLVFYLFSNALGSIGGVL